MVNQKEITSYDRSILVDWLIELHVSFKFQHETLLLSVNILDRFMSVYSVSKLKFQLLGLTCLFLASKYEEHCPHKLEDLCFHKIKTFSYVGRYLCTKNEILELELIILNALSFQLTVPLCVSFLHRFFKAAELDSKTINLTRFLLDLALLDFKMLKYLPSITTASSIYLSRFLTQKYPLWNQTLVQATTYTEVILSECVKDLMNALIVSKHSKLKSVFKKYHLVFLKK